MYFITCLVLAVSVALVNSQGCGVNRPNVKPNDCCAGWFPRFMTKELAEKCGLPGDMADGPPSGPPSGPPPCDAIKCILGDNNLLTDNKVNKVALKTFMEGQYSAEWKPIIGPAIDICEAQDTSSNPCPLGAYIMCVKHNMLLKCPNWTNTPDCTAFKEHITNCPPPNMKP